MYNVLIWGLPLINLILVIIKTAQVFRLNKPYDYL